MNVAFFLRPKSEVVYLYADSPLPEAMEEMCRHRYSSVPVIDREGRYVSTVSEGDFLRTLAKAKDGRLLLADAAETENRRLGEILREDRNPPCHISEPIEALLSRTAAQNFLPIVDDRGIFIGIVTRKTVIQFFLKSKA